MSASTTKILGRYDTQDVLLIKAVTNLHVGVGGATKPEEVVDLPIQRDWLGFPTIYGSSLKGSLKSTVYFLYRQQDSSLTFKCFGPDTSEESFSSPTLITDAYLLAFPARSLMGVYVYVTCPILLKRLSEFLKLTGKDAQLANNIGNLIKNYKDDKALCSNSNVIKLPISVKNSALINETLVESISDDDNVKNLKEKLNLDAELLLVNNDLCLNLVNKSLIRVARVRLKRGSKTVDEGPWVEEYVPPGTLFFAVILTKTSGDSKFVCDKYAEIKNNLKNGVFPIGGRETIGSGLVEINFWE